MTRDARATVAIAAATALVSGLLILTGTLGQAAIGAGFVPVRVEGAVLPAGVAFAVPLWLTPLTATLIHGGWAHLALNLLMFVFCGRETERALGAAGIVVLYLVGAYAAAAMQWVFSPASALPMIGASGAIFAVVGAYAVLFGRRRAKRLGPVPAFIVHIAWLAAAWIGIQLLIGFAGMGGVTVAIGAHIGGFVAGLVLARPLLGWAVPAGVTPRRRSIDQVGLTRSGSSKRWRWTTTKRISASSTVRCAAARHAFSALA